MSENKVDYTQPGFDRRSSDSKQPDLDRRSSDRIDNIQGIYAQLHKELLSYEVRNQAELKEHEQKEIEKLGQLFQELQNMKNDSKDRHRRIIEEIQNIKRSVDSLEGKHDLIISDGFGGQDALKKHGEYHKEAEKKKQHFSEILLEVKKKIAGGIVWGVLVVIGYALVDWLKIQVLK